MTIAWKTEIRRHAKRLRNVTAFVQELHAGTPEMEVAVYRELLLRAARLERLLDAKRVVAPEAFRLDETALARSIERAAAVARRNAPVRRALEYQRRSFWEVRMTADDAPRGIERSMAALLQVFDQESSYLLARFAAHHSLPVPPFQPSTAGPLELDQHEIRSLTRWLQRYRLQRFAFGDAREDTDWRRSLMSDSDEAGESRVRATVLSALDRIRADALGPDMSWQVKRLFEELALRVQELGFDGLIDSLAEGTLPPSLRTVVNIVPGDDGVTCMPIVIALLKGWKGRNAWSKAFGALRTHLINCVEVTRLAVVVCDVWDARSFESEFASDLRALASKGIQIVVLLAGSSQFALTLLDVDI
jgi:hypothetical protein